MTVSGGNAGRYGKVSPLNPPGVSGASVPWEGWS
jgi:hypothetical protein